ncbi:MAG: UDP-3-O-(3-hydroxymyristoyl)glucosamine N-acyltransferase [Gemmatimonadales bacterium]
MTAQAVADLVGGRLCGPGGVRLLHVRTLERAGPDALAMCVGTKWAAALASSAAGAVLLPEVLEHHAGPATRIVVADPARAMADAARAIAPLPAPAIGVDPTASVGAGTTIGRGVSVGRFTVIGAGVRVGDEAVIGTHVVVEDGVSLGTGVRLDAHVVVHAGAVLGDRVWCKAHAVIGGAGYGFLSGDGRHERVPQVGGCILGDDVEVGSITCIDRGSLDDTVIGRGTKIDNHVHVGHNVRIGEHCLLMAGVGISGSTRIGNRVVIAGQAGIAGHLTIGDDARIGGQAGVISSVPAGGAVSGFPARPHRDFLKSVAAMYRLAPHVDALEALGREDADG